jgi:hypothetical protein
MVKAVIILALFLAVISNYKRIRLHLYRNFGTHREHAALIVLGCLLAVGFIVINF